MFNALRQVCFALFQRVMIMRPEVGRIQAHDKFCDSSIVLVCPRKKSDARLDIEFDISLLAALVNGMTVFSKDWIMTRLTYEMEAEA